MLTHIRLQGFKSFVDQGVAVSPRTVCVGPNASGKSNFFDALRFLKGMALGFPVWETLNGHQEGGTLTWPGVRGGIEVARTDSPELSITTGWEIGGRKFEHSITCSIGVNAYIVHERVEGQRVAEFWARTPSSGNDFGIGEASVPRDGGGQVRIPIADVTCSHIARQSVGWDMDPDIEQVYAAMRAITTLDVRPDLMRGWVSRSVRELGGNAENLSGVLWRLCQDAQKKQAIIDWLRTLCAPELADLGFIEIPNVGDVMLALIETNGIPVTARSLSDGTLHFLGMLMAIYTAPANAMLLLEELDAGLHPSRLRALVEAFERSGDPAAQILATTHSPYVLAALDKPQLRDAIMFNRSPLVPGSLVRRLGDLPDFDEVEARLGIVRMFETEWLEQAL